MKKTSMPNPVTSLGYFKRYSWSSPRSFKRPSNSVRNNYQKTSAVDREDRKLHWKSAKRPQFSRWSTIFTNHRKKTNKAKVFSCRPIPNILKYRDHRWDLPTIWKTSSASMYQSSGSHFSRTTTRVQSGPDVLDEPMFIMTFLTTLL